jgi:hypothetical protein
MAYTTIKKPSDYFNTKLWTGTGANLSITGVGFQPDFTWIKNRANTDDHNLFDVLRGFSTDALLRSNTNGAATDTTEGIKSFDSDGFSLGTNGSSNGNGQGMASWNWKAGTGQGSSNTDGSINTTYTSVNTTAGFSISKFTGTGANATVGHGLGAVPKMIIVKNLIDTEPWVVYHAGIDATAPQDYHLRLNTTDARVNEAEVWNDTAPTSSVFSLGSSGAPNGSGDATIAYCFAEKTGYSKFGSYTGNGSADGTFVYTGFKPAFVMVKNVNSGVQGWLMFDDERPSYNVRDKFIVANLNQAEATSSNHSMDLLSNGFKIRGNDGGVNGSGNTLIFMAFAEEPLIGDNPATAK